MHACRPRAARQRLRPGPSSVVAIGRVRQSRTHRLRGWRDQRCISHGASRYALGLKQNSGTPQFCRCSASTPRQRRWHPSSRILTTQPVRVSAPSHLPSCPRAWAEAKTEGDHGAGTTTPKCMLRACRHAASPPAPHSCKRPVSRSTGGNESCSGSRHVFCSCASSSNATRSRPCARWASFWTRVVCWSRAATPRGSRASWASAAARPTTTGAFSL